jgi:hypothetical protein
VLFFKDFMKKADKKGYEGCGRKGAAPSTTGLQTSKGTIIVCPSGST